MVRTASAGDLMGWRRLSDLSKEERSDWRRAKRTKFLVDENLGFGTTEALRDYFGFNVKDVSEVGLTGKDDTTVFQYAWKTGRVLLTHDDGFLNDRRFPQHSNPGVVVLPGGTGDENALVTALFWCMQIVGRHPEWWKGSKVVFGSKGEVKIRSRDAKCPSGDFVSRTNRLVGMAA